MNDKTLTTIGQLSPPSNTKENSDPSFTFTKQQLRTVGSEEDDHQNNSLWNISTVRVSHFLSPTKQKYSLMELNTIVQQNQRLKEEIKGLKQLLVNSHVISKNYQKINGSSWNKKDDKDESITKLKKILQKSYYSIKQMEEQIFRLNEQIANSANNLLFLQKKCKLLQFQKDQLQNKLTNMNLVHKQEIQVCNDRIWRLQIKVKDLLDMVQQDKTNWNQHMQKLGKVKKVYGKPNLE